MQISRSTEESLSAVAYALGLLADTVTEMAGSLRELQDRVEHIEGFLESLEMVSTSPDYEEEIEKVDYGPGILPCGFEGDSEELSRWYAEGGPCFPQEED